MAPTSAFAFAPIPSESRTAMFEAKSDPDGKVSLRFNKRRSPGYRDASATPRQIVEQVVQGGKYDSVDDWDDTYYPTHQLQDDQVLQPKQWAELDSLVSDHIVERLKRGHMAVVSYGNNTHLRACLENYPKTRGHVLLIDSSEQLAAGRWAGATPRRAIFVSARDLYGKTAATKRGAEHVESAAHKIESKRLAMQAYLDALPRTDAARPLVAMGDTDTDVAAVSLLHRRPGQVAVIVQLEECPDVDQLVDELSAVRDLFKELAEARDLFPAHATLRAAAETLADKPAVTVSNVVSA